MRLNEDGKTVAAMDLLVPKVFMFLLCVLYTYDIYNASI